ncbi:MAG TPA: copper resistance protein CopC [Rhizomicrobium sp.]|nr:copper resistance protein CopC [Rhizomicrobium sp.]
MNRMLLAVALLPVLALPAFAHARLLKSVPAAGAKVTSPLHISLRFSEALEPAFSGALLLDEDGRNVSGEPVKINGPLITLTPGPLPPGVYHVSWHSVGHDTNRLDGDFSFTVKP